MVRAVWRFLTHGLPLVPVCGAYSHRSILPTAVAVIGLKSLLVSKVQPANIFEGLLRKRKFEHALVSGVAKHVDEFVEPLTKGGQIGISEVSGPIFNLG